MNTNVVVISDRVAPTDALGSVVYWSISGAEDFESFCNRLAGLVVSDDLPSASTPSRALSRAVDEVKSKTVFFRSLGENKFVIGHQTRTAGATGRLRELGTVELRRTKNENGDHSQVVIANTVGNDSELFPILDQISDDFEKHYRHELSILRPADIGAWLVSYATKLGAVALRPTGGFYFVPRQKRQRWTELTAAIGTPHKFYELPALTTSEAVHAITDALAHEIETATQAIRDELADPNKPVGKRALDTRAETCKTLLQKVRNYEVLLETKMDKLCENINYLEVAIATAKVTVMNG